MEWRVGGAVLRFSADAESDAVETSPSISTRSGAIVWRSGDGAWLELADGYCTQGQHVAQCVMQHDPCAALDTSLNTTDSDCECNHVRCWTPGQHGCSDLD